MKLYFHLAAGNADSSSYCICHMVGFGLVDLKLIDSCYFLEYKSMSLEEEEEEEEAVVAGS